MKTYKLLSEGFEPAKQMIRKLFIAIFLVVVAIMLFIQLRDPQNDLITLLIVMPLTLAIITFALYRGMGQTIKARQEKWSSYELLLDKDVIIRRQAQTPAIEIQRSEVTGLQEIINKNLVIKTNDKRKFIVVPASLDGYEEVKTHLAQWQKLETLPQPPFFRQAAPWFMLALLAGCSLVWISQDIRIILPVGFLLIAVFVWSTIETWRSPNTDVQMKRNSGVALGIVVLGIAVKTFILLMS